MAIQVPHVFKILFLTLALAGCVTTKPIVANPIVDTMVPRPRTPDVQAPRVMIVNRQNLQQFIDMINRGDVVYTLTQDDLNKIIVNNQEIMIFMANQNSALGIYEGRIRERSKLPEQ